MNDDDNKKLNTGLEETNDVDPVDVIPVGEESTDASEPTPEVEAEIEKDLAEQPEKEMEDSSTVEPTAADQEAEEEVQVEVDEENEQTAKDLGVEIDEPEVIDETTVDNSSEDSNSSIDDEAQDSGHPKGASFTEAAQAGMTDDVDEGLQDVQEVESDNDATADSSGDTTTDEPVVDDETPATNADGMPATVIDNPLARWYVVHTYSGHENRVATNLRQRIETEGLEHKIVDILVPTQDKIEIRGGKKEQVKEKVFPGYILVKMELDNLAWIAVRTTQGVIGFVGMGTKPMPISDAEVKSIVQFMSQGAAPTFKEVFMVDDTVKIIDGPFADFIGKVDSVDKEKGKLRVLVSIFGRETPVELDFLQVSKL